MIFTCICFVYHYVFMCLGIRGEIYIKVSVELIKDEHKNKRSSSEVLLFSGIAMKINKIINNNK